MRILIIGSGGREHALAWKLRQSPRVNQVFCVPGNAGIAQIAECHHADLKSLDSLIAIAQQIQPDLTIVGPEAPLAQGIVDEFNRRGWRIFGPTQRAARLESSKVFAKEFMLRRRIPTGHFAICQSAEDVRDALDHLHAPYVVKADGLAAGKGVVIARNREEAGALSGDMLSGKLAGEAGRRLVIEEYLQGEELSFMVLSDGERVTPLAAARDYKRVGDGDTGPNTGGMGSYSAPGLLDPAMPEWLLNHVARPVIAGMKEEDAEYRGILYCGLMLTARGPMVLEFNCRFGDPETQPVLMRLESDLVDALEAAIDGRVSEGDFRWSSDTAVCIVLASGGYPGAYEMGKPIFGLDEAARLPQTNIFHAGTTRRDDAWYTAGGRVLGVTARDVDVSSAAQRAYDAVGRISFDGMHYRKDVATQPVRNA